MRELPLVSIETNLSVVPELTSRTAVDSPKLEPLQLTAAGRAEFIPIASNKTSSGRDANRRIEMIISPNLDDLFKLLDE